MTATNNRCHACNMRECCRCLQIKIKSNTQTSKQARTIVHGTTAHPRRHLFISTPGSPHLTSRPRHRLCPSHHSPLSPLSPLPPRSVPASPGSRPVWELKISGDSHRLRRPPSRRGIDDAPRRTGAIVTQRGGHRLRSHPCYICIYSAAR